LGSSAFYFLRVLELAFSSGRGAKITLKKKMFLLSSGELARSVAHVKIVFLEEM